MRAILSGWGKVEDLRGRGGPVGEHCIRKQSAVHHIQNGHCQHGAIEAPAKQECPCAQS